VLTSNFTGRVANGAVVTSGRCAPDAGGLICDAVVGAVWPEENWQHGAGASGPLMAIADCRTNSGGQHGWELRTTVQVPIRAIDGNTPSVSTKANPTNLRTYRIETISV